MFTCVNDRYTLALETFRDLDEFRNMCRACFGEAPELESRWESDCAASWFNTEGELVLVESR